jgi:competence protein ComEC
MRKFLSFSLALLALLVMVSIMPPSLAAKPEEGFEIHFLDVGQGDSAIILCDGKVLLVDGGDALDSSLIYSYLKDTRQISHIDYMVSTHPHNDHVGGLSAALSACTVGEIFSPVLAYNSAAFNDFLKYAGKQGKTLQVPGAGDSFPLGSANVQFLTPLRTDYFNENDLSLVLRITYGNTSFLLMADAELAAEADIVAASRDKLYDIQSTLIKAGHHGRQTSTSAALLQAVKPEYAVISSGAQNMYEQPSPLTLNRLRMAKVTIYRTDMEGHIVCRSDGETLTFITEKDKEGTQ